MYITTCNNDPTTKWSLCRDSVKCRDYGCKTLRIDAPNNPVVAKLQILRPSAQPQTPTTKCSNVSPFRIWIELTDLALARYASHASHWFVASGAHPALHTQCCIPDPHHLERFQTMLCFCSLAATTSMWPVTPSQIDSLFMVDLNASFSSLVHRATCDFVQIVVEGDWFPKISSEIDLTHQN